MTVTLILWRTNDTNIRDSYFSRFIHCTPCITIPVTPNSLCYNRSRLPYQGWGWLTDFLVRLKIFGNWRLTG